MRPGRLLLVALASVLAGAACTTATVLLAFERIPERLLLTAFLGSFLLPALAVALLLGRWASAEEDLVVVYPDELSALRAELCRERPRDRSGLLALLMLAAFLLQGLAEGASRALLVLFGVLLLHEGGHALGMLAFGYHDVRVFFLPFLGAATTGRKDDAPAWQRAVVILAGPLPGLILGAALLATGHRAGLVGEVARMAFFVNAFNLLPFEPLDGGRLLGLSLLSRSPRLEAGFAALGGLSLAALAVRAGAWLLAGLGLMALFAVPRRLRLADAARRLRERGVPLAPRVEALPEATLSALSDEARALSPSAAQRLGTRALLVRELHARLHLAPPGAAVTLAVLIAYGSAVALSAGVFGTMRRTPRAAKLAEPRPAPPARRR